ncbi:short chain dehydrogenase/reductase [Xylogone sp. PMI_703]|nr:short chain dehydrogenase/reductase [Xylogone sp. PMI_703]
MATTVVLITGENMKDFIRSSNVLINPLGANSGVGYAASKVIANASKDYHVIMTGRSLQKVGTAKSEIEAAGIKGSLSAVQLDVTDEKSIAKAVQLVEEQHGKLDALINNAAVGNIDDDIRTRFQVSLETNVIGPALVAAAFRPLLFKSKNPYSIFVSSGVGSLTRAAIPSKHNLPNENAYRASKAALNMIAVVEWRDYHEKGLKVFAMCPGLVVSNLRGTSEEARTFGGAAGDPTVSGQTLLSILQGERDADAGKLVHKDGVYPW